MHYRLRVKHLEPLVVGTPNPSLYLRGGQGGAEQASTQRNRPGIKLRRVLGIDLGQFQSLVWGHKLPNAKLAQKSEERSSLTL